jgi:glycosyltransferase involved in cell wall biosynthesis
MKILFVASGNHGALSPVVQNQGDALVSEDVSVDYFLIKGKGIKGYLKNVKPLRKYLREHKYDAIHAHYSLSAFVATLAGAKPLVVSLMGSDVKAAGWYKFIIRLFAAFRGWKSIIVKSNDMYRSLGIKRAIIIPNGVNMERFQPMSKSECQKRLGWDASKIHILFPANASRPEKDFALAEAAVTLIPNAVLHAFENTPNAETPYWYNAADVVLMTSMWEGSPNAIKEAMACSRPIVATNVGDIAERTSGVEGCFVAQSREPQELASLLVKALAFSETEGRERIFADQLDRLVINQKLISVYQ